MSETLSHHVLRVRYSLEADLVCDTALHVGTGEMTSALSTNEMAVLRDPVGRPYIPGSSFRGALRSGLEALLRGLGLPGERVCDPFLKETDLPELSCSERVKAAREKEGEITSEARAFELAAEKSCEICRLFGHSFLASRVHFSDLVLNAGQSPEAYVRDGVGLDRDLRTAAKGILYSFEALPPGITFRLRGELENPEDHEIGLILVGLNLFKDGHITLGGKTARGLGWVHVENIVLTRRTAADLFAQHPGEGLSGEALSAFHQAARAYYAKGGQ